MISDETSAQMREILENVALQARLRRSRSRSPATASPTKTGTGEKSDGNGGYKAGVYFTTMIGFAPAEDPQYVVVVTLDEPTKVTSSAANATGVPEGHDPGAQDLPRHARDDGADAAAQVRE